MAVIDYKDVAIVANTLGIEGDYTSLEAKSTTLVASKIILLKK